MGDTTEAPSADDTAADGVVTESGNDESVITDGEPDQAQHPGREAAKWRTKLRDAESRIAELTRDSETKVGALTARVEHMQRNEVQRLVADRLADPADVWRDGAQLADVLDENGDVDPAKVNDLVGGLLQAHKHWGVQRQGSNGRLLSGASAPNQPRQNAWQKAFQPRKV